jgi:hypothetical protein
MLYQIIKGLHNVLRWVVVLGGIYAIVTSLQGLFNKGTWTDTNKRAGLIFTNALNIQFVLGIILYVVSPYINGLLKAGMGNAMSDQQSRFFIIEHGFTMILALVAAQLGYSLARRAKTDRAKFVRSSIGYVLAALLIAYAIPWSRPLFPGL